MNQLFKVKPPIQLVDEILNLIGIVNFNENYKFTREDIKNKGIIEKLFDFQLEKFYINCKYKKYFDDINEKKIVTILRQLVRVYGYKIESVEKFSNGKKYLVYHLSKPSDPIQEKKVILEFD